MNIEEKIRYLIVGGWNTIFGYTIFFPLYYFIPLHYMLIAIIANVFAITNAYLCYKFFVFKTRGNYIREYLKFYIIYGGLAIMGMVLLPILVELLRLHPVVAQIIIVPIGIIMSFIGHKNFSFREKALS